MKFCGIFLLLVTYITFILSLRLYQTCEDWDPIPEDSYNQTFVSITDPKANEVRPLGFKVTTLSVHGNATCVSIGDTGGNNRHIEIKWELQQSGQLCVRNQQDANELCGSTINHDSCGTVPGGAFEVNYTFYCQGDGCEGGDKIFWYRFVVESPMEGGGYDENWCQTRDLNYPSSLVQLPASIQPSTTTSQKNDAESFTTKRVAMSTVTSYSNRSCPEDWDPIPEDSYNQTYVLITDPKANEARPLGFKVTTLPFQKTFCVNVGDTGGNNRHIEIKWELQQDGTLFVKDNQEMNILRSSSINQNNCGSVPSGATEVTYTFYCQANGCEGGDKMFWYRFVVESPMEGGGYDENWCQTRDSKYPSSLVQISASIPPPSTTTKRNGAVSSKTGRAVIALCTILTFLAAIFFM
ncbi:uncharacterized protein LOC143464611 [Clavelina lepadiformis]|uniref:uncharacterized protein LOC143464611 n=1 Tax=Clavelina lepadiformis TaxID=159417 RepID=UPI004041A339